MEVSDFFINKMCVGNGDATTPVVVVFITEEIITVSLHLLWL